MTSGQFPLRRLERKIMKPVQLTKYGYDRSTQGAKLFIFPIGGVVFYSRGHAHDDGNMTSFIAFDGKEYEVMESVDQICEKLAEFFSPSFIKMAP